MSNMSMVEKEHLFLQTAEDVLFSEVHVLRRFIFTNVKLLIILRRYIWTIGKYIMLMSNMLMVEKEHLFSQTAEDVLN